MKKKFRDTETWKVIRTILEIVGMVVAAWIIISLVGLVLSTLHNKAALLIH